MNNSHIFPGYVIPRTLVLGEGEREKGGKFVFVLKKMYSNSPTAMQNSKKYSGGNTPDRCFGVGKEEDGEVCFRSPKMC